MNILENLSKRNIMKTVIFLLVFAGIFFVCMGAGNHALAASTQIYATENTGLTGIDIIDGFLQIVYMIFYPLIFLAGLAMDNSLVYGAVFHLDVPLWRFWNIIKNLANFTLGFIVLFTILKNVFSIGKKVDDVKKVITKTLIAGVLVQASWFLTAVLIDISTVATYGVGALPMSVLEGTTVGNQKILAVDSVMDLDKSFNDAIDGQSFKTAFRVKYNGNDVLLSPCKLKTNGTGDNIKTYIVGRKYYDTIYQNYGEFGGADTTACVANSKQIVIYNESHGLKSKSGSNYESYLNWMLSLRTDWKPRTSCGFIIDVKGIDVSDSNCGTSNTEIINTYNAIFPDADASDKAELAKLLESPSTNSLGLGFKAGETRFQQDTVETMTIAKLIDKSKGLVGPMMTIFSSMMNFAQISENSQDNGIGAIGMETLIKSLFALAIFFPLLALTVILVARIGILWLVVAMSPFIVLLKIFKDELGSTVGKLAEKASLENIIQIIFSPVVIVFALSMSIIFLQTLISGFNNTSGVKCERQKEIGESMMITPIFTAEQENSNNCITNEYAFLDGLIKIKANGTFDRSGTGDLLSRTMINIMAIALVWFLLFVAIKASSKLGEAVGQGVQDFGASVMGTMPVLPIPGSKEKAGISAWKEGLIGGRSGGNIAQRFVNNIEQQQESALTPILDGDKNKGKGDDDNSGNDKHAKIIEYIKDPTTTPTFDGMSSKLGGTEADNINYMTKTKTLEAIQSELAKNNGDTGEAIKKLVSLLGESINKAIKNYTTKAELEGLVGSIYNAPDKISKEYIGGLMANDAKNVFEIMEGGIKKEYKIKKNNGSTFELEQNTP